MPACARFFANSASDFDLTIVAEGIERIHESHKLQALGCHIGQGYLFAKPMPKAQFLAMMRQRLVPTAAAAAPRRNGLARLIPGFSVKA